MKEKFINWLIKISKADTNKISDGYHTFGELYEHRIELWICILQQNWRDAWRSRKHFDGSKYKGWFIAGLNKEVGKQMTYHLPLKYWHRLWLVDSQPKAPRFDGHTPVDVIKRLREYQDK